MKIKQKQHKSPILIDLDGVLRIDNKPAVGLQDFLDYLLRKQIPACILSNSTQLASKDVARFFLNKSINLNSIPVMTAVDATLSYVKEKYNSVSTYCSPSIKPLFSEFETNSKPEAVVIGDIGDQWNYEIMNDIFLKVNEGADIIAMQMNKYWKAPATGLCLDAGPFIKGIEFATGKKPVLIGKPSPLFFQSALKLIGRADDESFIMLGDDLAGDIKGAQDAGGKAILIYTGKTSPPLLKDCEVTPDYEAYQLDDVIEILENN